ncbi:hypothetical protein NGA_0436000 [Nannochloropsis gaditana CCMP526]|uniref:uncharacterized protein n=1 Tax=Nannochloropsis gaditana (strain CCMP526) TaxID=1093141 RepID=UPI00029F53A6|nr:hypothetical protein NGA_0436000 [Nannochloropsis gaditana CCMP526]EKU22317.1 hypothetical protein NGA_0436000 [Nannochloropsis gaditana CCMP526]|eukprot:XP_005854046.1 hypothetical protein NGA_0436000 [Nannochloropsis gaditana CCMP526]
MIAFSHLSILGSIVVLLFSVTNAFNLRGTLHAEADQNGQLATQGSVSDEGTHRMLPPLSHLWAYEGGSRTGGKEEVDAKHEVQEKDVSPADNSHRMLPPLSHGWAYERGSRTGGKGEVDAKDGKDALVKSMPRDEAHGEN